MEEQGTLYEFVKISLVSSFVVKYMLVMLMGLNV